MGNNNCSECIKGRNPNFLSEFRVQVKETTQNGEGKDPRKSLKPRGNGENNEISQKDRKELRGMSQNGENESRKSFRSAKQPIAKYQITLFEERARTERNSSEPSVPKDEEETPKRSLLGPTLNWEINGKLTKESGDRSSESHRESGYSSSNGTREKERRSLEKNSGKSSIKESHRSSPKEKESGSVQRRASGNKDEDPSEKSIGPSQKSNSGKGSSKITEKSQNYSNRKPGEIELDESKQKEKPKDQWSSKGSQKEDSKDSSKPKKPNESNQSQETTPKQLKDQEDHNEESSANSQKGETQEEESESLDDNGTPESEKSVENDSVHILQTPQESLSPKSNGESEWKGIREQEKNYEQPQLVFLKVLDNDETHNETSSSSSRITEENQRNGLRLKEQENNYKEGENFLKTKAPRQKYSKPYFFEKVLSRFESGELEKANSRSEWPSKYFSVSNVGQFPLQRNCSEDGYWSIKNSKERSQTISQIREKELLNMRKDIELKGTSEKFFMSLENHYRVLMKRGMNDPEMVLGIPGPLFLPGKLLDESQFHSIICQDGSKYSGKLSKGRPHGFGRLTRADQRDYYEGEFFLGKIEGVGKYKCPIVEVEGIWSNWQLNGFAKESFVNGSQFEGVFRSGFRTGRGQETRADGEKYAGGFAFGARNGYVKYFDCF